MPPVGHATPSYIRDRARLSYMHRARDTQRERERDGIYKQQKTLGAFCGTALPEISGHAANHKRHAA